MRKVAFGCLLVASVYIMVGCGNNSAVLKEANVEQSVETSKDTDVNNEAASNDEEELESTDTSSESDAEDSYAKNLYGPEEGLYDRTYLYEENGKYIYSLTDTNIIEKYDELYANAFQDMVDSYDEVMKWQNQSYDFGSITRTSNLLYKNDNNTVITLGSYYEMDYNFDLNNVGYTYVDLDSDGICELIFGVLDDADADWIPKDYFERAYALVDEHVIKICEGGSRDLHWLGLDGYIYETGSGGAAYWGISRLHFNPLDLEVDENTDWGSNGFVEDEFIGYLGSAVHINGSSEGIGDASQVPDSQISEDECSKLIDEWETRQVDIDWLRMSDYMMKHSLSGV